MASIIDLGYEIAGVHHQYAAIHASLFGAASIRLVVATMTGRLAEVYEGHLIELQALQIRLADLSGRVTGAECATAMVHMSSQIRGMMTDYAATLKKAMSELQSMVGSMLEDEKGYRQIPAGGQSKFNRDKTKYDLVLLQLEQEGSRLNKLFSRF